MHEILTRCSIGRCDHLSGLLERRCRLLGLGARACFIGRPYVYGLGAAGARGVSVALDIFRDDLDRVMRMTGVSGLSNVPRSVIDEYPEADQHFQIDRAIEAA